MDAQIIISREDNTDFLSLGNIQTDTSLVSALGGALADFAAELGLTKKEEINEEKDIIQPARKSKEFNISKFQKGILASNVIPVGDHQPVVLMAVKEFQGTDEELAFLTDYATILTKEIVQGFEKYYSIIGFIPPLEEAIPIILEVTEKMAKKYKDIMRKMKKSLAPQIDEMFINLWENQDLFEDWSYEFEDDLTPEKIIKNEWLEEIANFFYLKGLEHNALFPLYFTSRTTPFKAIQSSIYAYLENKDAEAIKDLKAEILVNIHQLQKASQALSKRGSIEFSEVDLLNAGVIFEKIMVAKEENLESISNEQIKQINNTLYQKLVEKYPLKYLAIRKAQPFNVDDINEIVKEAFTGLLEEELKNTAWIRQKLKHILREVTDEYSAEDVSRKKTKMIDLVYERFIELLKKEHPFILLGDPKAARLSLIVKKLADETFERYQTTLDEAVILYYILGQIHSTLQTEVDPPPIPDLMTLYFLQTVLRPYQYREIPDLVYTLVKEGLSNVTKNNGKKPAEFFNENMKIFEKKIEFQIAQEAKTSVVNRLSQAKLTNIRFETFENLSFFFKSYRSALEDTLKRIFQYLFGPEKSPHPPSYLVNEIIEIILAVQNIYNLSMIIQKIVQRPGGRDLFSNEQINFIKKNSDFQYLLPIPEVLAEQAYKDGKLKLKKKIKKINFSQTKTLKLEADYLPLRKTGSIESLLQTPLVLAHLWNSYLTEILAEREKNINDLIQKADEKCNQSERRSSKWNDYKKISSNLKRNKKSLKSLISGGGFLRKIFTGQKELSQLIQQEGSIPFPTFTHYMHSHESISQKISSSHQSAISFEAISGDFQNLLSIYASIWVADSEYIDWLEKKLFQEGLQKNNSSRKDQSSFERKLKKDLVTELSRKEVRDHKTLIRSIVEEEIIPQFNQIIRIVLDKVFTVIKDDKIVKSDGKQKNFYIQIARVSLPKRYLKQILGDIPNIDYSSISKDSSEIRYILKHGLKVKKKESQTLEKYMRLALVQKLNEKEFKALEFFGDLTEEYIGKTAANTFFSHIRHLAQLFLSPSK
jgi:hypothetical protein